MRLKSLEVNGTCVSLYNLTKDLKKLNLFQRRLVPVSFIELWYKVSDGEWDNDLWYNLRQTEKDFMAQCADAVHISNKKLNIAIAKESSEMLKRLQLLEGVIQAGNLNRDLVDEFKQILSRLSETRQMPPIQASRLKQRIERTYAAQVAKS